MLRQLSDDVQQGVSIASLGQSVNSVSSVSSVDRDRRDGRTDPTDAKALSDRGAGEPLGYFVQVPCGLKIHPILRRGVQPVRKGQGGLGTDASLAVDQRVNPLHRHPQGFGQFHLADPHRLQKFLEQDLAWMRRRSLFRSRGPSKA